MTTCHKSTNGHGSYVPNLDEVDNYGAVGFGTGVPHLAGVAVVHGTVVKHFGESDNLGAIGYLTWI